MTETRLKKVVTWQSPSGRTIHICPACERKLQAAGDWPKDRIGQEYCQVSHGLHEGVCNLCDSEVS
jgi:hypothetical protein